MTLTNILAATLTAYCACRTCCGANAAHGITASGVAPRQGITVAASRNIPFGSRVIIGTHTFIVQDRLAKRFDNRIDIFFNSHADARKFGITRGVRVMVVTSSAKMR